MKVVSLYSPKGGVGKSTLSVQLAFLGAQKGYRTLLVDLDSLGSSSHCLHVKARKDHDASVLLEGGKQLLASIQPTDVPLLHVLPSSSDYFALSALMAGKKHPKHRLERSFSSLEDSYDLVVLDGSTALDVLAENLLNVSTLVIIPVIPTPLSVRALEQVLALMVAKGASQEKIHPCVSLIDRRKRIQVQVAESLHAMDGVFRTEIPSTADLEKVAQLQEPVFLFHPNGRGAKACRELFDEVLVLLDAEGERPSGEHETNEVNL
ncbi:MAG: ParA family protein [Sphaerochaeta sp.]|nr:ParA family protein [Sphaerochaeta sp.]MDD3930353.1 ParA family protein [Sphaerochaeta sp.]